MSQDKPAYQLFDGNGKKIKYKKILKLLKEADVIFFGELHNNPIAHWLQLEVLQDLTQTMGSAQLVVGAEMYETHQQAGLDKFLAGEINVKELEEQEQLWPNHDTDYRPVLEFCESKKIPVVATNIPRKYARTVAFEGGVTALDSLPADEKALMVPLSFDIDYELPSYAAMRDMMGGHAGSKMSADNFIAAQAIKDATMAHFLLKNLPEGKKFYHLNGSYHSDSKEGIAWYVKQARPDLTIVNLTVVEQKDISELEEENEEKADIVIVVPATMTKTYRSGFE
ncbi:MAG: ChaN family lipoprotein [Bacteroidota bacterium]